MQVYYFRGNPIVLVIVSTVFSILLLVFTIFALINKVELPVVAEPFILFVTLYNSGLLIALYLTYHKSDYAFMSPKKYQKAMRLYEKNQKLMNVLGQIDEKYKGISPI